MPDQEGAFSRWLGRSIGKVPARLDNTAIAVRGMKPAVLTSLYLLIDIIALGRFGDITRRHAGKT